MSRFLTVDLRNGIGDFIGWFSSNPASRAKYLLGPLARLLPVVHLLVEKYLRLQSEALDFDSRVRHRDDE
jgi:hypothetical protein